jgi:hypothetical protein
VTTGGQPIHQSLLVFGQIHGRDTDSLEAEFPAPVLDLRCECCEIHASMRVA